MSGIGLREIHILLIVAGFVLSPVIIAAIIWESSPRRRMIRWIGRIVLVFVGVIAVHFMVHFIFLTVEQKSWYPRDAARLGEYGISHAREGIVLDVYAPAGVPDVWRGTPGPGWKG